MMMFYLYMSIHDKKMKEYFRSYFKKKNIEKEIINRQ